MSALSRRHRAGDLADRPFQAIIARLQQDRAYWELVEVSPQVLAQADDLVRTMDLRTLDAIHVASVTTLQAAAGAVNRFSYAGFYAGRALLATKEVDSSRHSGVISLFQKHFVTTGQVSPAQAKALPRSFEKRQNTDYADFAMIAPEEARSVREDIRAFVMNVQNCLSDC